jgi:hypothetical protein
VHLRLRPVPAGFDDLFVGLRQRGPSIGEHSKRGGDQPEDAGRNPRRFTPPCT